MLRDSMVFATKLSLIFELSKSNISLCLFCSLYFSEWSVLLHKSSFRLHCIQAFSVTEHRSKIPKCSVLCWVEGQNSVVTRAMDRGAGKLSSFFVLSLHFSVVLSSFQCFLVSLFPPSFFSSSIGSILKEGQSFSSCL